MENIIQVWRVMVLHRSTQIYQHKLSFEVGGSLKGEISIQIIKTARLKDERTGMQGRKKHGTVVPVVLRKVSKL